MAQVQCTICGGPASHAEDSGPVSLNDVPANESGIVCASCSSKLSAEIAKQGTSVLTPTDLVSRELIAPLSESARAIGSSAFSFDSKDSNAGLGGPRKAMPPPEFDFARKRRFGSYEILGEISRGSFGVVYKARQAGLDRIVALKVLLDGVHASPEAVERFQREARSVARMKHASIVPIYDIGTCDGHYYFAMEFIEGHPLSTHILARELTISHALAIAEASADAMECAHRAGVIHRDLKPSNILIDKDGEPHITDFGLAKQVDLENKYTMSGTTLGTPAYMPPEQARGQLAKIDARSDVYAIGTVLFEMLTGTTPFAGRSLLEVVVAVINEPVPPPRSINPKIHRDIQTIVLKCLEKDQNMRYASAAELRDDLRRFRSGEAIIARPAGLLNRSLRYIKRQKWYVASAASVALAFFITMLAIAGTQNKEASIKKREEKADKIVEEERKKSEEKWIEQWAQSGRDAMPQDKTAENMYSRSGRVNRSELMVSPEAERFWGDFKARIRIELTTDDAVSRGFSFGFQSYNKGIDAIPYLFELRGQAAQLTGPQDLYGFQDSLYNGSNPNPRFEVKLEKKIQPLRKGVYELGVERLDGTRVQFTVNFMPTVSTQIAPDGAAAWPTLKAEIEDFNLSNWMLKYARLVIPRPPPNMALLGVEVQRKFGSKAGPEVRALNSFRLGEYTAALGDFKVLAVSKDELNAARAHYYLGLIDEILKNEDIDQILEHYREAAYRLTQMRAPVTQEQSAERSALQREIRIRRIVCYAKKHDWSSIKLELEQGWMSGTRVGETLGWELQGVLEAALQDAKPGRGDAIEAALAIFRRAGLEPTTARLTASAEKFGMLLAKPSDPTLRDQYIAKLNELRRLVPTSALDNAFAVAAGGIFQVNPEKAFNLLNGLEDVGKRSQALNDVAAQTAVALEKIRNHAAALQLLEKFPSKRAYVEYLKELNVEVLPPEPQDAAFYAEIFPAVARKGGLESRQALEDAAERLAKPLAEKGRGDRLISIHKALRLNDDSDSDARLVQHFATALDVLALGDDRESALRLLEYAYEHVSRDDAGLIQEAAEFAQKRSADTPEVFGKLLLKIKEKYPPADIANHARDVLHKLSQAREYAKAIDFFKEARTRFLGDGAALLPDVVAAFENLDAAERDKTLDAVWVGVRDELKKIDDEASLRAWQLEFGDILLALSHWDPARKQYQGMLGYVDLDPPNAGRAALRLIAMRLARPESAGTDALAPVAAAKGTPEEIRLAAQLLSAQSPLSLIEFAEKLKGLEKHELSGPEIDLVNGLRMRIDGDDTGAQQLFKQALERAQPERLWPAAVASELLRPPRRVVEREPLDSQP